MSVQAVLGLHFGDEGKGQTVSNLLKDKDPSDTMVVRFSGGANAGHTVVYGGDRFVFSHFGSGTLQGFPTYWGPYAIANPILFNQELKRLNLIGKNPRFFISPKSRVTSPIDMMANQVLENWRGKARHGSCGVGIHTTVARNMIVPLRVGHLATITPNLMRIFFENSLKFYESNFEIPPEELRSYANVDKFMDEIHAFIDHVQCVDSISPTRNLVFEGSQGLRLSANRVREGVDGQYLTEAVTDFSHVNQILTGIYYAGDIDIYGVTRPYLTRHGNGPLPGECPAPFSGIKDLTNVPNEWQGSLRFAKLTPEFMSWSWKLLRNNTPERSRFHLAITCMDQLDESQQADFKKMINNHFASRASSILWSEVPQ